ncbi:MAG: isoprenyl transferase [Dethiobacteria bacterium]|jgi:undecaprenyl diphosphate synthase
MGKRKRELELSKLVSGKKLPRHIAIIMDGNGRWARKRGLPRIVGHRAGMKTLREIVDYAHELGIKMLSLYAFSTENWKRPLVEVEFLMRLPEEYLQKELPLLMEKNIVIRTMGELVQLPERTQKAIKTALDATRNNTGMILNFAFNYGGRTEIIHAVKKLCEEVGHGRLKVDEITEDLFGNYLYSGGMPDPDLLIRPSGELRISNFLLWQLAYTELWFTRILWPDFQREHFLEAVLDYQIRERRFGGISKL